ncbi:cyclic AMP-responsive element-binding protein 3-like protein 1 isoform X1 [Callorhinchus milii]|uniref:cAMP responsive element binding protein 3-like 1 n=1 Tax=Callorhinchus milii TaxID=7868 RepID=A0A4W3HTK6_CALMI|nr:cyclic AMP-responsive element-binding protein 3-like protein 1 isoform X1 [Callorhinchus milii]|eukprot:gi/632973157/ref/XP_007903015.1/ PREDICTED: cyclic AMP-responsive element-binding protein 3-like protein 1 isoform X1 [Callorhinchus milii]
MDILDNFGAEKLFAASNLVDLEDLNETDFLSNVHFSENLDDFSNELFSSFFDDPLLAEKNHLLDMELDPATPDIQAEHSYSLSGDSAPQSPLMPIKMDEYSKDTDGGIWSLGPDLTSIMIKQEPNLLSDPSTMSSLTQIGSPSEQQSTSTALSAEEPIQTEPPQIKTEPKDFNQLLSVPADEMVQLPPTPPSSHSSDSDGSQSPRSLPPSSPARPQPRSSSAISSSPLLTAPHKLQGTSGPLILTEEEKRTLIAEGYPIPNKLPLTKAEEKALKRVRRKIKNKISAQESRRKKKEYVDSLEKKVETYTSENNELWKKVETLENANRTLLQQLQKLQAMVAGKVTRQCRMASTQTGTCLMVVAVCFILVLGSFMPCLPEFSSVSQTVKATPLSAADVYTTSQIRSRSLLFYDEGSSLEDHYTGFFPVDNSEKWEPMSRGPSEKRLYDQSPDHMTWSQEASKYLSEAHMDTNKSDPSELIQEKAHRERWALATVITAKSL